LNIDDELRLTQIISQTRILTAQLLIFFFEWIALRLRPASLWGQRFANTTRAFSPPGGQQRGVQAFSTKKSTDGTACRRSDFGFFQDALLIFSGVGPLLGFGWLPPQDPAAKPPNRRPLWLPLHSGRSQTPRRRNNTHRIPAHL
jgi:hypothetical protein